MPRPPWPDSTNSVSDVPGTIHPPRFHFKNVFHAQGGASGSNAARFLNRAEAAGAARKEGREYVKVEPQDTR